MTAGGGRQRETVSGKIGRDTVGVSLVGALSRSAPLFSTITIAAFFGTGRDLDIYYLTLVFPIFLSGLVGMAITTVFVPVLVEEREKDQELFPRLLNSLFSWVLLVALGLSLIYVAAVPLVIPLVSGAFDESGRQLAVKMSLGLSPIIPLITARSFVVAIYHSRKRFILPTVALSLTPVTTIACILLFERRLTIHALVLGNVLGHFLELAVLLFALQRAGACPKFALTGDRRLKRIFKLSIPQVVSSSVLRLNPFVDRTMASLLVTGSISALVYAERMQSIPQQFLSLGFFNVILAHWSFERVEEGITSVGESLLRIQRAMIKILVPSLCFLWLYRSPLISCFLQRGAMNVAAAEKISSIFGIYLFQVAPLLITLVYVRALLVMKETVFLMRAGFCNAASKLGLNCLFLFGLGMGVEGIALATVVTSWIVFFIFLFALRHKLGFIPFHFGTRESLVTGLATLAAAAGSHALWRAGAGSYNDAVLLLFAAVFYASVYALLLYAFREQQYFELRRLIARR